MYASIGYMYNRWRCAVFSPIASGAVMSDLNGNATHSVLSYLFHCAVRYDFKLTSKSNEGRKCKLSMAVDNGLAYGIRIKIKSEQDVLVIAQRLLKYIVFFVRNKASNK